MTNNLNIFFMYFLFIGNNKVGNLFVLSEFLYEAMIKLQRNPCRQKDAIFW